VNVVAVFPVYVIILPATYIDPVLGKSVVSVISNVVSPTVVSADSVVRLIFE
jgi:hypothetical protein